MMKPVVIVWWAGLMLFCLFIACNGGGAGAWFGVVLSGALMFLEIFNWGDSNNPHDWSA
jgi:hypothetical protein